MTQPEALRLADLLERDAANCQQRVDAAIELRRLHAENEALREANEAFGKRQEWWNEKMFAIEQQRDALLEALKEIEWSNDGQWRTDRARATIKAVEGEKA